MKTIKLFQASMLLVMTLIAAGCANDEAKTEQQGTNGTPAGTTIFSGETNPSTTTRTAIVDHTQGAGAKVNWAATDQVWVKDDANTWQQSGVATFPVAANKAQAMFALNGTYTGATHDVIYTNIASPARHKLKSRQRKRRLRPTTSIMPARRATAPLLQLMAGMAAIPSCLITSRPISASCPAA